MKPNRISAIILCALLLCAVLSGCGNGKDVDGNVVIELEGNPTTGYTWIYEMSQTGIIEEVSNTYIADDAAGNEVGVGGTFRFEFSAVASGEVGLRFTYLRTFQENSELATVDYAIVVADDLTMTLYETDGFAGVSDSDATSIVAGRTYVDSVVFGETTEDVVFTWTLCNAGIYIGVDTEYIQWYYADGADHFVELYPSGEELLVGTSMTVRRFIGAEHTADEYADMLAEENGPFTDFSRFSAEIGDVPAVGVICSAPDSGLSAVYYFVETDGDVLEIAIFYEGESADNIGARLDAMVNSIIFSDNIGIIE